MEQGNIFKYSVPFTMVANELIMCEDMSPILKTVYSIACCYASSQDASCYPSYTTIARKAGICRSTAIKAIRELIAADLLSKETKQNTKQEFTSNTYVVNQWNAMAAQYFHCSPPTESKEKDETLAKDDSKPDETEEKKPNVDPTETCAQKENTAPQSAHEGSAGDTPPTLAGDSMGGSVSNTPPPSAANTLGSAGDTPPFILNNNQINNNHGLNNNQSINQDNSMQKRSTAFKSVSAEDRRMEETQLHKILANCELNRFTPDVRIMFQSAIERIFYSERLKIGTAMLPKEKIRAYLWHLDTEILDTVLKRMSKNEKKILNPLAWLMSTIINEICTADSEAFLALPAQYQNVGDLYV